MFDWPNKLRRDCGGTGAVEFALTVPVLLMILAVALEGGNAFYQATTLATNLRAAALYAARSPLPLSSGTLTTVRNLVKTGAADGAGSAGPGAWSLPGASIEVTTASFDMSGTPLPMIRIAATVPYQPLVPGLFAMLGATALTISDSHEQAYVGD